MPSFEGSKRGSARLGSAAIILRGCFHASLTGRIGAGWCHRNPDSDSSLECDNGQPRSSIFWFGGQMKICPACVGDNAGSGNDFSVRREKVLAAAIRTT